ncbi:MAG TPA: DUF2459 domain-containing protein [Stellaceae bacterium]|nr:DUF2459 domain-containing protein [Stellaceae bacterium]
MARTFAAILLATLLSACAAWPVAPPCPPPSEAEGPVVYVAVDSWHADIGLPSDELTGPLAYFRQVYPNARAIMFGYGKRTFITAPTDSLSEYLLGPVPGPAAIQLLGLSTLPDAAYLPGETVALHLTKEGEAKLEDFIWQDLAKDASGKPKQIDSSRVGILFYAANSRYTLLHTCNSWAVDALAASGLPLDSHGVIFSGQAMARAQAARARQCTARQINPAGASSAAR